MSDARQTKVQKACQIINKSAKPKKQTDIISNGKTYLVLKMQLFAKNIFFQFLIFNFTNGYLKKTMIHIVYLRTITIRPLIEFVNARAHFQWYYIVGRFKLTFYCKIMK